MVNIVDALIILFLAVGALIGYKKGAIGMLVSLISVILVFYLSYILKTPLATFMYNHLPYIKFGGIFRNIPSINILFYNVIAFVLLFILLSIIFKIVIKLGNFMSKIVDHSIVLTLPSKLIGICIGLAEAYILIFVLILLFSCFSFSHEYFATSKLSSTMLTKTPFTTDLKDIYKAYNKISEIKHDKNDEKAIKILKKYNIITSKNVEKLIKNGKIKIERNGE